MTQETGIVVEVGRGHEIDRGEIAAVRDGKERKGERRMRDERGSNETGSRGRERTVKRSDRGGNKGFHLSGLDTLLVSI